MRGKGQLSEHSPIEIENYGPKEIKVGDRVIQPGEKILLDIEECQREAMQPGSELYEMVREHWRATHEGDGSELSIKKGPDRPYTPLPMRYEPEMREGKGPLWLSEVMPWIYIIVGIGVTVLWVWALWE